MTAQQLLRRLVRFQGIVMALAILVATASILSYRAAAVRVQDTDRTLIQLETLRSEVLSGESSLRGYLLVEQPEFLEPYTTSGPVVRDLGAELRRELPDEHRPRLAAMLATWREWRSDFAQVVLGHLSAGRDDDARALVASGAGKRRIDDIRQVGADLTAEIRAEQTDNQDQAEALGWIGVAATVLAVVLIIGVGGAARRRVVRRIADPLAELAATTERFGSGDLSARASADGVEEVRRVANEFNAMASRTEAMVSDLRAVDRLKSEFVSVVSHELRTPLTSIRGSLGLLASGAMGELPDDAHQMVAIATSNTDRLVRLINDILDLQRIESGQEALEVRSLAVAEVVEEAVGGMAGAAAAAGVGFSVVSTDVVVVGDRDRLVQALTNLLGNAVKFSESGTTVSIDVQTRGDMAVLRVRDQGRGIPADKLEAIFERFQQVDASDAREKGGTGLGLAIVRSIAARHGGRVEVDSVPGEGSTFSIVLPRVAAPVEAGSSPGGSALVVLAEDDDDLRIVLRRALERHGLEVVTAVSASEAVERCQGSAPDLLVLDVRLAGSDGYEVVQALRLDDRLRSLPTVVYTVADLTTEERDRLRLGPTVFIAKGQRTDDALEQEVLDLLARVRG